MGGNRCRSVTVIADDDLILDVVEADRLKALAYSDPNLRVPALSITGRDTSGPSALDSGSPPRHYWSKTSPR